MKTFYGLNEFLKSGFSFRKFAVTIGVFDGLHTAHQKIIKTLVKKAASLNIPSLLITFDPHPMNILNPSKKVPLLISLEHRLRLLKKMGLGYVIVLGFDKALARMPAADFIKKVLGRIRIAEIIVGGSFFFGREGRGSLADLKKFSDIYGYKVSFIENLKSAGKTISSTWIRDLILNGKLEKASKLLSRPVTVLGTVVKGTRRGRIIGYPTANIDPHHEAIPPSGVYAVKIRLRNRVYEGILNIGIRPTFHRDFSWKRDPTIEVHIFNFNKSIYGEYAEIMFIARIRNEKKFKDANSLKAQIAKDEICGKRILGKTGSG